MPSHKIAHVVHDLYHLAHQHIVLAACHAHGALDHDLWAWQLDVLRQVHSVCNAVVEPTIPFVGDISSHDDDRIGMSAGNLSCRELDAAGLLQQAV